MNRISEDIYVFEDPPDIGDMVYFPPGSSLHKQYVEPLRVTGVTARTIGPFEMIHVTFRDIKSVRGSAQLSELTPRPRPRPSAYLDE